MHTQCASIVRMLQFAALSFRRLDMINYLNQTDDTQREVIINEINTNMFVEAGAGAGKTTMIVSRLMKQFEAGMKPEKIVVITFTNAAAEELRQRITAEVEKRVTMSESGGLYESILNQLDKLTISTIHSFCNTILSEKCFRAKLPIGAKLLEEEQLSEKKRLFFETWFSKMKKDDWDKLKEDEKHKKSSIKKDIYTLFHYFVGAGEETEICLDDRGIQNRLKELDDKASNFILDAGLQFVTFVNEQKRVQQSLLFHEKQDSSGNMIKKGETLREIFLNLDKYTGDKNEFVKPVPREELLRDLEVIKKNSPSKSSPWFAALKSENGRFLHKDEIEALNNKTIDWYGDVRKGISGAGTKVKELLDEYDELNKALSENERYTTYCEYAKKALDDYRETRSNEELTNDLLLYKMNVLMRDKEVRAYYAKKYDCFYVDEFQDTDRIQAEFIWNMAADTDDSSCGRLRDGALFLVGDPKQSIYRFRGAQPEVFFDVKNRMQSLSNAEIFSLSKNYRSNEKIIEWVNKVFANADIVSSGNYQAMVTMNYLPPSTNNKRIAGFYNFAEIGGLPETDYTINSDVENVAALIRYLISEKYVIHDTALKTERTVMPSDFLILCDKKDDMQKYVSELEKYDIPVSVMGKLAVDEEYAVRAYIRLYTAIAGKNNRLKCMGAVEALRKSGFEVPKLDYDSDEEASYEYFSNLIATLRSAVKNMSAYGKAWYLLNHLDLFMPKAANIKAFELQVVMSRLQQMLETCASDSFESADTLTRKFIKYVNNELERELMLNEASNAVRFMNLHKAKGLEGNIVIWAKRDMVYHFGYEPYRSGNKYYPALKKGFGGWSSYKWTASLQEAAEKEFYQEVGRLEYVAATRARQAFIFMPSIEEKQGVLFQTTGMEPENKNLYSCFPFNYPDMWKNPGTTSNLHTIEYEPLVKEETPMISGDGMMQDVCTMRSFSPSHFEKNMTVKYFENGMQEEDDESNESDENERPIGRVAGNILHRSFELAVKRRTVIGAKLEDDTLSMCIRQAVFENRAEIMEEHKKRYEEFTFVALKSGMALFEEKGVLNDKKEIHAELPFSFYESNEDGSSEFELNEEEPESDSKEKKDIGTPILLNGFMDLLILDRDGSALIFDYKSDGADNLTEDQVRRALTQKYSPQMEMYRKVTAKLYGIPMDRIKATLVFFREYNAKEKSINVYLQEINACI